MDLAAAAAECTVEMLREAGADGVAVVGDVTEVADMDRTVDAAMAWSNRLDVMVNNAGHPLNAALLDMDDLTWRTAIDLNLTGTWLGTQRAARVMTRQRSGSIINMSSIAGKVGSVPQANYSAAKAGIVGLTKAAAKELGPAGVRVNAIQPGSIRTDRTALIDADSWASKVAEVPLGREGTPAEVASVALFLASDLSSYVTGAAIEVAGGRYM